MKKPREKDILSPKNLFFNLHLLSFSGSKTSGASGSVKSSKLIINNEISSTSERIGAITSEHKNFVPEIKIKHIKIQLSVSFAVENLISLTF